MLFASTFANKLNFPKCSGTRCALQIPCNSNVLFYPILVSLEVQGLELAARNPAQSTDICACPGWCLHSSAQAPAHITLPTPKQGFSPLGSLLLTPGLAEESWAQPPCKGKRQSSASCCPAHSRTPVPNSPGRPQVMLTVAVSEPRGTNRAWS